MKKLNTRRVDLGMIKPEELPDGVTYIGYLNDRGWISTATKRVVRSR
ncbi:hypothetical protein ACPA9J_11275 [Pseudomonas aeruginosa]